MTNKLCIMCGLVEKFMNHFFICNMASGVLNLFNKWVGVNNVHHFMHKEHFSQFYLTMLTNKQNIVWKGMLMAIL